MYHSEDASWKVGYMLRWIIGASPPIVELLDEMYMHLFVRSIPRAVNQLQLLFCVFLVHAFLHWATVGPCLSDTDKGREKGQLPWLWMKELLHCAAYSTCCYIPCSCSAHNVLHHVVMIHECGSKTLKHICPPTATCTSRPLVYSSIPLIYCSIPLPGKPWL